MLKMCNRQKLCISLGHNKTETKKKTEKMGQKGHLSFGPFHYDIYERNIKYVCVCPSTLHQLMFVCRNLEPNETNVVYFFLSIVRAFVCSEFLSILFMDISSRGSIRSTTYLKLYFRHSILAFDDE